MSTKGIYKPAIRSAYAVAATALTAPADFLIATFIVGMGVGSGAGTALCVLGAAYTPLHIEFAMMSVCFALSTGMNVISFEEQLIYGGLRSKYNNFLNYPERVLHRDSFLGKKLIPAPQRV